MSGEPVSQSVVIENARVVLAGGGRRRLGRRRRRAHRRGRRRPRARAGHRSRRRSAGAGADRAAHRSPGEPPASRGLRCAGRPWPRWWPTMRRSWPPASPRCSTRCASATTSTTPRRGRAVGGGRGASRPRAAQGLLRCRAPHAPQVRDLRRWMWWSRPRSSSAATPCDLISLMDHTPGARQFRNLERLEDLLRRQVGAAAAGARPLHGQEARPVRRQLRAPSRRAGGAGQVARHRGGEP